jgi:hypothetical protein
LDDSINLDNLCLVDVDAIILFLRATSYGPEFPIQQGILRVGRRLKPLLI